MGKGSCSLLLGREDRVTIVSPPADESVPEMALAELDARLAAVRAEHEFVVIDAPSGLGPAVRWALDRADAGLMVIVDEPTAIADAYALCKLVWSHDAGYPLAGAVNLVDTEEEAADVLTRFSDLTGHFLDRKILYGGWVPFSGAVRRSVRRQEGVVLSSEALADAFGRLGDRLRCGVFETTVPISLN